MPRFVQAIPSHEMLMSPTVRKAIADHLRAARATLKANDPTYSWGRYTTYIEAAENHLRSRAAYTTVSQSLEYLMFQAAYVYGQPKKVERRRAHVRYLLDVEA